MGQHKGKEYEELYVVVETDERTFRGYIHKPTDPKIRFSDYLNNYEKSFICLTSVQVFDRGQLYKLSEKHDFIVISVASITFIAPFVEKKSQ